MKVHLTDLARVFSKVNEGKFIVKKKNKAFTNIPIRMGLDFSELISDSRVRKNKDTFNSN